MFGSSFRQGYRKSPGREVNCDSDEAPQRQRPTTPIRRQREATLVTKDVHHVDDAADEVHEQPQEATVDDEVVDAQGFSGRPHDTSVLTVYVDHVAVIVWNGEVFIFLNKFYFNKYLLLLLK